ncbi:OmpA family protein [Oceanospirillaceae bacterium]|jgi:outer membrane protein OmpA-like peptidoglycan-associated protein|nr:OmpA family protein [Oceanospirillaceae bacterium]|tara:strand:+ start:169 stop:1014 length:846 start_codon:yes stop_codon:yes gene_type:complete
MKTKNQLVLAMTIAIITMPVLAAGPSGNNDVWTSGNGSTIVDGNGNPIRTIHYQNKTSLVANVKANANTQPSPSLLAVIKKAVTKAFNVEADPTPMIATQEQAPKLAKTLVLKKAPVIKKAPAQVIAASAVITQPKAAVEVLEEVAPALGNANVKVTAVKPPKIDYSFHDYKATVLFDTGSAVLTEDASSSLTQLAMATKKAEKVISLQVLGHADTRGDAGYNMTLSEERMLSVAQFFDGLKLKVTSMFAKGETSPVMGTEGEDLTLSRRVQVFIKTRHID